MSTPASKSPAHAQGSSQRLGITAQSFSLTISDRWFRQFVSTTGSHPISWLVLGVVLGLAGTVRWQMILLGVPLGIVALFRGKAIDILAFVLGTGTIFSTVPLTWLYMFGSPSPSAIGTVPNWIPRAWDQILFSPVHGLFTWSPLTVLGLLGILMLVLNLRFRALGLFLFALFVIQVLMNATVVDPLAGWSFGMRRMTEVYPAFALGLAWLLSRSARFSFILSTVLYIFAFFLTLFSVALLFTYGLGIIHPGTGSILDALEQWTPPNTSSSLDKILRFPLFRFGRP